MINNIFNYEGLEEKKNRLHEAETILKTEFVGIDDVIDGTISNVRPWYLYPELQDKPLVITLVGMSGTGKTSLVKRLCEILDLEKDMGYFNFGEINEQSAWEIEDTIDETLNNGRRSKVFVYDEFQYAATLDEDGSEKENKGGMKTFWELMDTGLINRRFQIYEITRIRRALSYALKIDNKCHMIIRNGVWENCNECLSFFNEYDKMQFSSIFNVDIDEVEDDEVKEKYITYQVKSDMFLTQSTLDDLYRSYSKINGDIDIIDFRDMLVKMDFNGLCSFLEELYEKGMKGYSMDFSKSIVFVLMNLDEAYQISFDVNPDMLPDQFYKITKKLTVVDIKQGLKRRFRNEQIARLGNIFMIYPAFSSETFMKIIVMFCQRYAESVKEKFGIAVSFDETVLDLIYKDAVFPTHGTRPIISSIHEIVKTKLPIVVDELSRNGIDKVDNMVYSYDGKDIHVKSFFEDKEVGESVIEQPLRVENHRNVSDTKKRIAIAVHESGHFVMYTKLYGKIPEKVCVGTVNRETGGFMLKDADDLDKLYSKEECMAEIKISLAGYVAEKMVFGDVKRTNGASEDLANATVIASQMVRKFGFGSRPEVTTYLNNGTETGGGNYLNEDTKERVNSEVKRIISSCIMEIESTFANNEWKKMLKDSASYLLENPSIPKEKMQELYDEVSSNLKKENDEKIYLELFNKF